MAGQRQPTGLIIANGKKHLTKAEIEERLNGEISAPSDHVKPPTWLTPKQKAKFKALAKELMRIDLVANLDVEALARLIVAQDQFIEITQELRNTPIIVTELRPTGEKDGDGKDILEPKEVVNGERERLLVIQDRCFKQCRQGAADFGLTVSARCRIVVPKPPEGLGENKFARFAR